MLSNPKHHRHGGFAPGVVIPPPASVVPRHHGRPERKVHGFDAAYMAIRGILAPWHRCFQDGCGNCGYGIAAQVAVTAWGVKDQQCFVRSQLIAASTAHGETRSRCLHYAQRPGRLAVKTRPSVKLANLVSAYRGNAGGAQCGTFRTIFAHSTVASAGISDWYKPVARELISAVPDMSTLLTICMHGVLHIHASQVTPSNTEMQRCASTPQPHAHSGRDVS